MISNKGYRGLNACNDNNHVPEYNITPTNDLYLKCRMRKGKQESDFKVAK